VSETTKAIGSVVDASPVTDGNVAALAAAAGAVVTVDRLLERRLAVLRTRLLMKYLRIDGEVQTAGLHGRE
jgi:hypothetical protein